MLLRLGERPNCLDERCFIRKATSRVFGKNHVALDGHVEHAAVAANEFRLDSQLT